MYPCWPTRFFIIYKIFNKIGYTRLWQGQVRLFVLQFCTLSKYTPLLSDTFSVKAYIFLCLAGIQ